MHLPFEIKDRFKALTNFDSLVGCGYQPLGGVVRIDDNDPRIEYSTGDWGRYQTSSTGEGVGTSYYTTAAKVGATTSFSFTGTALYINAIKYAGGGKIGVSIDGGAETVKDLYYSGTSAWIDIELASGLTYGYHTVVITIKDKNPLSSDGSLSFLHFKVITTTDSSLKLSRDGIQGKSSALTLGQLCESDIDISQNIAEITQLGINTSYKRIHTWGAVFQDDFGRADGAIGNGWGTTGTPATISGYKMSLPADNNYISNGSVDWTDRQIRFSYTPILGKSMYVYIKYVTVSNFIYVSITAPTLSGNTATIKLRHYINGEETFPATDTSFVMTSGTTYYITATCQGNIYSFSITSNADYVTNTTTIYSYTDVFPTGRFAFSANEVTLIDSISVTAPVPYGYTLLPVDGVCYSIKDNVVKAVNNLSVASGMYLTINSICMTPVTAGQSYTFKVKRKVSAYTSGNGALCRILWYQSDGTTNISTSDGDAVTTVDSDFVEMTFTAAAPANAAYASYYGRFDGIGTCEWKEPLFELTSTAVGIFHEKESRMDLVSLNTDEEIVVTRGTGESEMGYRVEQDGVISKFYRDSATIPHWDRVKVWKGGTGWIITNSTSFSNSSSIYTITQDDNFTISFVGTGMDFITVTNVDRPIIGITIDDGTEYFVDLYSSSALYSVRIPIRGLSYGHHQVKLRHTNTKNGLAVGGLYFNVDAFDILTPKIPDTPANCQPLGAVLKTDPSDGWIRFEETEGVIYSGDGWSLADGINNYMYSNSGVKVNNGTLNSYAEFSFLGTGIRWIGSKYTNLGIGEVFTDEGSGYVSRGTVDEYGASALYKQVIFTRTGMTLQLNKIKINVTHTKNASATDYVISVDALEVQRPLYVIDLRKQIPEGVKDYIEYLLGNVSNLKGRNIIDVLLEHIRDRFASHGASSTAAADSIALRTSVGGLKAKTRFSEPDGVLSAHDFRLIESLANSNSANTSVPLEHACGYEVYVAWQTALESGDKGIYFVSRFGSVTQVDTLSAIPNIAASVVLIDGSYYFRVTNNTGGAGSCGIYVTQRC